MSNSDKIPTTSTGLFTRYHPAQSTSSNMFNFSHIYTADAFGKRYIFHVNEVLKRLHLAALHSLIKTLSKCDIIGGKILHRPSQSNTLNACSLKKKKKKKKKKHQIKCKRLHMCDLKCSCCDGVLNLNRYQLRFHSL